MLNASIRDIPLPARFKSLPVSDRGFPVPWFVAFVNGNWDFRQIGTDKIVKAVRGRLCWLCGQPLGQYLAFVIGPMCSINRVSAEPPSHRECAEYAVRACPFLAKPNMRRNAEGLPDLATHSPGGIALEHNPGATLIWITKRYSVMRSGPHGVLFEIGDPTEVAWYAEGRKATRAEIDAAIEKGLPFLHTVAAAENGLDELQYRIEEAKKFLPAE